MNWEALYAVAQRLEPKLKRAFLKSIAEARVSVDEDELAAYLQAGNLQGVVNALIGADPLASLRAAIHLAAVQAAGDYAATLVIGQTAALQIGMNVMNPNALASLEQASFAKIKQISDTTREGIRQYLLDNFEAGKNPRALIAELAGRVQADGSRQGGILGLTERQAKAVSNYRKALTELDPKALDRALRDKRFDGSVERALQQAEPLPADRVDYLVTRYEANMLAYRAETIARTESMRALAEGQEASWDQAIANGIVSQQELGKVWRTALDERVREAHAAMEGTIVAYDELFDPEDTGPIWAPPQAPNCRCIAWIAPLVTIQFGQPAAA